MSDAETADHHHAALALSTRPTRPAPELSVPPWGPTYDAVRAASWPGGWVDAEGYVHTVGSGTGPGPAPYRPVPPWVLGRR